MIIDFKQAKIKYTLSKIMKNLRKIYNDISIIYGFTNEGVVFTFTKGVYTKTFTVLYIELDDMYLQEFLEFNLYQFSYEVYNKRKQELDNK